MNAHFLIHEMSSGEDPATRPRESDDRGTSLIEILVTVVVMAVVVTTAAGAVLMLLSASRTSFDAAETETALLNAASRIHRAEQSCDYDGELRAEASQVWTDNSALTAAIRVQEVPPSGGPSEWVAQPSDCGTLAPFEVQEVTITAAHPRGSVVRSITIFKTNEN